MAQDTQAQRMRVIALSTHPCRHDRSLRLTGSSVPMSMVGREIYQGVGGFVATLPNGMCISGFFPTEESASDAQRAMAYGKEP